MGIIHKGLPVEYSAPEGTRYKPARMLYLIGFGSGQHLLSDFKTKSSYWVVRPQLSHLSLRCSCSLTVPCSIYSKVNYSTMYNRQYDGTAAACTAILTSNGTVDHPHWHPCLGPKAHVFLSALPAPDSKHHRQLLSRGGIRGIRPPLESHPR